MWQHLCSNEFVLAFVNHGSVSPWTQEQRSMQHHHCLGRIYLLCTWLHISYTFMLIFVHTYMPVIHVHAYLVLSNLKDMQVFYPHNCHREKLINLTFHSSIIVSNMAAMELHISFLILHVFTFTMCPILMTLEFLFY